jgi:hypothetical protein
MCNSILISPPGPFLRWDWWDRWYCTGFGASRWYRPVGPVGPACVRIPTIVTTRTDGSRPVVPIDRDHCGAEDEGAVRCIW